MMAITPIGAFKDNYIWLIHDDKQQEAIVVDPGDALPVQDFLNQHKLNLVAILLTHHHHDHIGGVHQLLQHFSVPVYGPAQDNIATVTHALHDNDEIYFGSRDLLFRVLRIPGHTHGHIAYYGNNWLFCGDTLFTGGCGRLFEGTAAQLFSSLHKLAALPETTEVYCGHEYTLSNLRFALTVEPSNILTQHRLKEAEFRRSQHLPTVPSTLAIERMTNPFLRCHETAVRESVEQFWQIPLDNEEQVFTYLRRWKDQF